MPTARENLQTAYDNVAARLAEVTSQPKPSYSIEGVSVSWESYLATLTRQLAELRVAIDQAEGPFELSTEVW